MKDKKILSVVVIGMIVILGLVFLIRQNKIKSDMAKYLTESLTRRFRSGVLSLKQIATMAGWNE